jgi:hypothetical protein
MDKKQIDIRSEKIFILSVSFLLSIILLTGIHLFGDFHARGYNEEILSFNENLKSKLMSNPNLIYTQPINPPYFSPSDPVEYVSYDCPLKERHNQLPTEGVLCREVIFGAFFTKYRITQSFLMSFDDHWIFIFCLSSFIYFLVWLIQTYKIRIT